MVETVLKELNKEGCLNHVGKVLMEQPEKFTKTLDSIEKHFKGYKEDSIRKIITSSSLTNNCDNLPVAYVISEWVAERERKLMGFLASLDYIISGNALGLNFNRGPAVIEEETIKRLDGLKFKVQTDFGYFSAVAIFRVSFSYEGFSRVYCKIDQITEDGDLIMGVYKGEWRGLKYLFEALDNKGLKFISQCIGTNLL